MAKTRVKSVATQQPIEPLINPDLYTQIAFIITLALVIARAMMTENVRDGFDAVAGGNAAPRSPGPGSTLLLDALCLLPAMLVLLRRVMDRQYVIRATWSHVLVALLAIWATLSLFWSTDKFLTLITVASTIASASLIWSTAQLVRSWLRLRIAAGVCVGLLLIYAAQGLTYRFIDVPDNVRYWNENKDQILREHGWEPGSFSALQFEKKLTGGEMIGFNTSPNSFAAVIVMLLVITTGVAIQRAAREPAIKVAPIGEDPPDRNSGKSNVIDYSQIKSAKKFRPELAWAIGIAVISLPVLVVLYFTHTRTAVGTLVLALIALALLASSRVRNALAARPARAYWIAVLLFAIGVAALVGHGITHGSLPQDSLNFRWRYWVAAARLVRQHPLAGVGWGNFGEPYLSVRLPIAAEEIRDPHNFIVRAFAELGIIGGFIALAWLARSAWEITRPIVPTMSGGGKRSALIFALVAVLLGVLLNLAVSIDFAQPSAYLTLEVFRRLLALGLLTIGVLVAAVRPGSNEVVDVRPAPWLLSALLIALGAFFVHSLMEFVLVEPGPLMLFSLLLGTAIGLRTPWTIGQSPRARKPLIGVLAAVSLAWLILIATLVIPIAEAEQRARDADDQIRANRPDLAASLLAAAFHAVPYNSDYAFRTARAMVLAGDKPERALATLDQAIAADPRSVVAHLVRANVEMRREPPDANAVRVDYDSALHIDPQNVQMRLDYAEALQKLGEPRAAAEQLKAALATNAQYHPDEPKRLSPAKVKEIEELIEKLSR